MAAYVNVPVFLKSGTTHGGNKRSAKVYLTIWVNTHYIEKQKKDCHDVPEGVKFWVMFKNNLALTVNYSKLMSINFSF